MLGNHHNSARLAATKRLNYFHRMTWQEKISAWRKISPARRKAIRLAQAPRQVALSMAFEGEPVDGQWLKELHRRKAAPAS
jgi:hypothetical protein